MGSKGCTVFWLATAVHNCTFPSGGFTMALFRTLAILFRDQPIRKRFTDKKMVNFWIGLELALLAILVGTNRIGTVNSGSSLALQFCNGHSSKMEAIALKYDGVDDETLDFGLKLTKLSFALAQLVIIAELVCYIYLFCYIRKHNRTMLNTVSHEELRRRHRGNVINMSGQAMVFTFETLLVAAMQILLHIENNQFFPPASFSSLLIGTAAMINIAYVAASPELRRLFPI